MRRAGHADAVGVMLALVADLVLRAGELWQDVPREALAGRRAAAHQATARGVEGYAKRAHVRLGIVILAASGWLPSVRNNDASNIAAPGAFYLVVGIILPRYDYPAAAWKRYA